MARKINYYKFGTEDYPIPVLRDGNIAWLSSEKDAVILPTMREENQDFLYGMIIRNCVPDTNMLPIMEEMFLRLDPVRSNEKIKSYNYQIVGTPGGGKTYIMKQFGKLVHPKGALIEDCKEIQNPEHIYKVTTFNVEQANKQSAIDGKLLLGNANPDEAISQNAVAYLKSMLGNEVVSQEMRDGRRITSIDWNLVNKPSDYVDAVLAKVCEMENIKIKENNNSIGFKIKNGSLLNALANPDHPDYGRMVILDESNRMPELYHITAFFSEPGDEKLSLKGEDDNEFTIFRKNIPATFMLYETGNKAIEGMGDDINVSSKPSISRKGANIDTQTIPVPSKDDYIARVAKHMTGVPAMQIYLSQQDYFDQNPQDLRDTLYYMRTVGLTKDQIAQIPRSELYNIENFDKIKGVCGSYGTILHQADNLINEIISSESKHSVPESYREYLKNEALVDLRYAFKLLQHSEVLRPQARTDVSKILKGLGKREKINSGPVNLRDEINGEAAYTSLLYRGTNLENEVAVKLKEMFIPKDTKRFLDSAENSKEARNSIESIWSCMVKYAKEHNFEFAGYKGEDSVAKTYNVKEDDIPEIEATKAQKVLLNSIEEHFKDELGDDGICESILSKQQIMEALRMIKNTSEARTENGIYLTVPNLDLETLSTNPLKRVLLVSNTDQPEIPPEYLLTTNQFADTFILKDLRTNNFQQYWRDKPQFDTETLRNTPKTAFQMATNRHPEIATTTVILNHHNEIANAHIIHNKKDNKTIILTDFDISLSDKKSLKHSGIFFLNLTKYSAEENAGVISKGFDRLTDKTNVTNSDLVAAIMLRVDPELAESDQEIIDLCEYLQRKSKLKELPAKAAYITNIASRSEISPDRIEAYRKAKGSER